MDNQSSATYAMFRVLFEVHCIYSLLGMDILMFFALTHNTSTQDEVWKRSYKDHTQYAGAVSCLLAI